MNKKAIIQTQLMRQLKGLVLFIIGYAVLFVGSLLIKKFTSITFDFDGISYIFVVYLAMMTWLITSRSIKLYSYHSYSRKAIISRTVLTQLIVSFIGSLLILAHTLLMKLFPLLSTSQSANQVKNVYIDDLTSNIVLKGVLTCLFITLAIFTLLQLTNLFLIGTYAMRLRTQIILFSIIAIIILGILFSVPFWSKSMIGFSIMILGFLFGTGQSVVPAIVIPAIILIIISVGSYLISRRRIKKLEIYKNITL